VFPVRCCLVPRLRTLGRLELVAGEPPAATVIPTQRKRLALLAYLALATPRGPQRRDALVALFWPEADQEDARRSLRQALHALRSWLGDGVLLSSPDDQVGLTDGASWCDAVEFERAIGDGRPADALALYQGAFLDSVFVSDASPEFEQWADTTRQRLRTSAARAATQLAVSAARAGDGAEAVRWAATACDLAPDDEPNVRRLMEALRAAGDHAGALRTYQTFAQRMAVEFEAAPAPETQALRTALRVEGPATDNGVASSPRAVPAPAPLRVQPPPQDVVAEIEPVHAEEKPPDALVTGITPPRARLRLRLAWTAFGATTLVAGYLISGVGRGRGPAPGVADRILVADFRNHTRDSLLGGAVTEALRTDLAQSRVTRVMSRPQVQAALQRMQQPAGDIRSDTVITEIAEREGVKAIVVGEVAAVGTGFTVSAQLVSVRGSEILAAVRETAADSTKLLGAIDAVSAHLRRGIGESLLAVRSSPPLEQVTTSSLQALRLYSQAIRIGDHEGDDRRGVELLRQAIAADTTFAMAYRKLGVYLRDFDERAGADEALSKAFRYRQRLPENERYNTAGMYYANAGLFDSAMAAYSTLLALYPSDMRGLNNLGSAYEDRRDFNRAVTFFRRAVESDSSVALLYNHLATAQLNAGDYDAASRTLAVRRRKFAPQIDAEEIEIPLAIIRGDLPDAQRRADRLVAMAGADVGDRSNVLTVHAGLALLRGRLAQADSDRRTVMGLQARGGTPGVYLDAGINLALADIWYRRQPARGLETIDAALARYPLAAIPPLDRDYALLSYAYALAGRPARARALLIDMRANESVAGSTPGGLGLRDEGGYLRSQGATELAEGRVRESIATLRRAVDLAICPICALPDLGRAYEAGGERDSAIATYERYVTTPWSDWQLAGGEFRGSAYQRLGTLYEERGDTARAITAYAALVTLWSAADSELGPQTADARRRSALLRGKGR
jgi:DNA-binding SARP family transcriptional activator/Flp pilus assembly protein TadD/TolB-like protein